MKLEHLRVEIELVRGRIRAQRSDIRKLEYAGISTKSAEELLARMALSFRATLMARLSRVNSSMMHNIRNALPSWVRSATKS